MSNEDKILQLVLMDSDLCSYYQYNPSDFASIDEALESEIPIVVAVAKIIRGINGNLNKSIQREVYNEVHNYLNNLL